MGVGSRRQAEQWIKESRISVNGNIVDQMGMQINPLDDQVCVDGKLIQAKQPPAVYWLLHKPDLYLCSARAEADKKTIFDLPKLKSLPFAVKTAGRLDFRTEGLLILSNDGEFIHRLTHPSYKVPRRYYALLNGKLSSEELSSIQQGIRLEDGPTLPAKVEFMHGRSIGGGRGYWYTVTVYEGRNRLVRRIFAHFGKKTVRLIRYGIGDIELPESLKVGEYQALGPKQLRQLKQQLNLL